MKYAGLIENDISAAPGISVSFFTQGCPHRCVGCHNPETWDFAFGEEFTHDVEDSIIKELSPSYITGLTVLGGEPFEPANQQALLPFLKRVKKLLPNKTIWIYTGYKLDEELLKPSRARCEYTDEILSLTDVLVDGEFVEELKNISLRFRGSSNQRIIDVPQTLKKGEIVIKQL